MAAMKYYSVGYFFQEYDSCLLRRKVGKYASARLIVLNGALFLTSKPMSSIRRAVPSNVCRYFSSPGHKMLWRSGKSAWTGSIKRYSWEWIGKPNQVCRMAV